MKQALRSLLLLGVVLGGLRPGFSQVLAKNQAVQQRTQPADIVLQGTVRDDKGESLPGVSIVVKGTQRGTTTDAEGRYKIDVPNAEAILIFSYVGYLAQEVSVGNRTTIDVVLSS